MSDQPTNPPPSRLRDLPRTQGAVLHQTGDYGMWNRPDRPLVVGVIGWICAAIGYFTFFLKGSQLPAAIGMDMSWLTPGYKPMPLTRFQFMANISILLVDMAIGLMAIAGGLGVLRLREWARRTLVYYALIGLAFGLLRTIYQIAMLDAQIDFQISTTTEAVDRNAFGNTQFFYLITTAMMGGVWSLLVLGIMTRGHVRKAFNNAEARLRGRGAIAQLAAEPIDETAKGDDDWRST